ncbi:uncharacterized protein PRCAT00003471001 [Priceomyces carsonii]|uniref:uncharacterized protein n=1 Tax=Priceomyces carsonii TaxID=28549 RepID=UPI002ED9D852|nr:unnamed protein product [Priceomyces carsonii]
MTDKEVEVYDSFHSSESFVADNRQIDYVSDAVAITEGKPWYRVPYLLKLNLCIFLITLTSTNNGYDGSMLNGLQLLTSWNKKMSNPSGAVLGALSNGNTFGVLLSFAVGSYMSDKFGRKPCIIIGQIISIIGAILQGVSTDYAFFFVSRLVIGFGSGFATVSSPTLISEIAYPSHREVATSFYNTCWYLGAIVAAWVTYGTRNIVSDYSWRIPSYLQGFFPLVQVLLFWIVPESPRYYISKGKYDEAEQVLKKWHIGYSNDDKAVSFVKFEMNEIKAALELEKLNSSSRYVDFVTNKRFRKRLFLICMTAVMMQLSGNGLVSYYLSKVLDSIGITDQSKKLEINGCLMIYNFVLSATVAAVVNRFKRRKIFITSISLMLIFYIIWTALSAINQQRNFKDKGLANGILAMIFLYYFAYDIGANGLPFLYITEILPYSHRTKGINIFQVAQNIIIVYNGFVNPIAMDAIEWKYYIVYCCILAAELVIFYFVFVETSGCTLEEVAKVFGEIPDETALVTMTNNKEKPQVTHVENV